jgi:transcriptional regulator with XRE-family HTH domain
VSLDGSSRSTKPCKPSVRLLQAACELSGGEERLAERLQVSRLLLRWYLAGKDELPSHLLLRTVDIILDERESGHRLPGEAAPSASGSANDSDPPA